MSGSTRTSMVIFRGHPNKFKSFEEHKMYDSFRIKRKGENRIEARIRTLDGNEDLTTREFYWNGKSIIFSRAVSVAKEFSFEIIGPKELKQYWETENCQQVPNTREKGNEKIFLQEIQYLREQNKSKEEEIRWLRKIIEGLLRGQNTPKSQLLNFGPNKSGRNPSAQIDSGQAQRPKDLEEMKESNNSFINMLWKLEEEEQDFESDPPPQKKKHQDSSNHLSSQQYQYQQSNLNIPLPAQQYQDQQVDSYPSDPAPQYQYQQEYSIHPEYQDPQAYLNTSDPVQHSHYRQDFFNNEGRAN